MARKKHDKANKQGIIQIVVWHHKSPACRTILLACFQGKILQGHPEWLDDWLHGYSKYNDLMNHLTESHTNS